MNDRAGKVRNTIASSAIFVFMYLSLALKAQRPSATAQLPEWGFWGLTFLLSLFFGNVTTDAFWHVATRIRMFRRLVLGRGRLEGCWFFEGTDDDDVTSLAQFFYIGSDLTLFANFHSAGDGLSDSDEGKQTMPLFMAINDRTGHYVHSFLRRDTTPGVPQVTGVAVGDFSGEPSKPPTSYLGSFTYLLYPPTTKNERGFKMPKETVRELKARYGTNWQYKFLHDKNAVDELRKFFRSKPNPQVG